MTDVATLTRADLADALHAEVGLSRADSAKLVEDILACMCHALAEGENVKISGFGTFVLRDKGERVGRNPKTGVEVPIAPRRVLTFRASQTMRDRIVAARLTAMPPGGSAKSERAFRTIGEVSARTGVPQHVLRYWETRFPALRPVTRAGGRRYYRPEDVALVERIEALLRREGYTIRGVQQLLAGGAPTPAADPLYTVRRVRDLLAAALAGDEESGGDEGREQRGPVDL